MFEKEFQTPPAWVVVLPNEIYRQQNDETVLTVEASGFPRPCYHWYIDDVEVFSNEFVNIIQESGRCHLKLKYTRHSLTYVRCEAANVKGRSISTCIVVLNSPPEFLRTSLIKDFSLNVPLLISTKIRGHPEAKLRCLNKKTDLHGPKVQLVDQTVIFSIKNPTLEHVGLWKILATNLFGSDELRIQLTVKDEIWHTSSFDCNFIREENKMKLSWQCPNEGNKVTLIQVCLQHD